MRTPPRRDARSHRALSLDTEPFRRPLERASGVLCVDDDPSFIDRARALAEPLLLRVHAATTPPEALAMLGEHGHQIEAAFLNIDLLEAPRARQWIESVRAHPLAGRMALAFVSQRDDLQTQVWAAHHGARLFLKKPVDAADFTQAIHQLVALRRAPRPRVLLFDEDPLYLRALCAHLDAHRIEAVPLADATALLSHLRQHNPDALIIDAHMPGLNGHDLCRVLRTISRWQDLPVLVVGREDRRSARLAAFDAGADAFLSRHSPPAEFVAHLHRQIERSRMMRQRADRDPLTGLLTRRALLEALAARLSEVSRKEQKLVFCLLDLDHFKRINDTHGHLAGDRVLAGLGRLLQDRFRVEDLRGRWGGEEFVVVMTNQGTHNAQMILERLRIEFAQLEFQGANGQGFRVSFSAGIAEFPAHGREVEALFNTADRHLYAAKAAGRNQILHAQTFH